MNKFIETHSNILLEKLIDADFTSDVIEAQPAYLNKFVLETQNSPHLPIDKLSRWLGYSYGVLLKNDVVSQKDLFVYDVANKDLFSKHPIVSASIEILSGLKSKIHLNRYNWTVIYDTDYAQLSASFGFVDYGPFIGLKPEFSKISTMIEWIIEHANYLTVEEISLYLGVVQGYMVASSMLDVKEERDRTRPIFHKAYEELGILAPKSVELKIGE